MNKETIVSDYQAWLDLQHYSKHLLTLYNIKNRPTPNPPFNKNRSQTLHLIKTKININTKTQKHHPSKPQQAALFEDTFKKIKERGVTLMRNTVEGRVLRESINFGCLISEKVKARWDIKSGKDGENCLSPQGKERFANKFNSFLSTKSENFAIPNKFSLVRCATQSNSIKKEAQKNEVGSLKQLNHDKMILKNHSILTRHKESREKQLKKYFQFNDERFVKRIHKFQIQISVFEIHLACNESMLSFWIEANSLTENVRSPHYTLYDLKKKPIYLSFSKTPLGIIKIWIKYFRKLDEHTFGEHCLVVNELNEIEEMAMIESKENGNHMNVKFVGKKVEKRIGERKETKFKRLR